jgi:hypothetical protein
MRFPGLRNSSALRSPRSLSFLLPFFTTRLKSTCLKKWIEYGSC